MKKDFDYFSTLLVQNIANKVGPTAPVVVSSASYGYENASQAEDIFSGNLNLPLYARVGNPTNAKLESVVSKLENGFGGIATSSGMGALHMVFSSFLNSGDEILCVGGFFGGTYTLVNETLKRFGVKSSFCAVDDMDFIKTKLENGVKIVALESVGNPSLRLPNLKDIALLCKKYETLLVVDNTATPILLRPLEIGADIVVHSSTKNMSGHSAALGGIAIFREVNPKNDKLLNEKYADIHKIIEKVGKKALVVICKKRALRDVGMSANAFGSFLTLLGLETLSLRVQRVNESVVQIVSKLNDKLDKALHVNHLFLNNHIDHKRYMSDYPNGCGPIFTIDCGDKKRAFDLLDNLKLVTQTANIGDNRTLALHMKSTIYRDFDEETRRYLGISDGLIRVSVGLENPDDIIKDFLQASKTEKVDN